MHVLTQQLSTLMYESKVVRTRTQSPVRALELLDQAVGARSARAIWALTCTNGA